jgi:IS605 OrfB family transposase
MIRTSNHILKFANKHKLDILEKLYRDYQIDLQYLIDLMLLKQLPIKSLMTSPLIPENIIHHSHWKQILYKHASEIVRGTIKSTKQQVYQRYKVCYRYFKSKNRQSKFLSLHYHQLNIDIMKRVKIKIENVSIPIDERRLTYDTSKEFDEFIGIGLPYKLPKKISYTQYQSIHIPIKYHKQSLKFKSWARKKTVQLRKINGNFYITFFYEKDTPPQKREGQILGLDSGYKKLLVDSNGNQYGKELESLYERLARKKKGSKNYQQLLTYRSHQINRILNNIDLSNTKSIIIEDLKYLKQGKNKSTRKFRNKRQYWTYRQVIKNLELKCEQEGVELKKVSPAYTSQTCSKCGTICKDNRKGELYQCNSCGNLMDADHNASINILRRGIYSSSNEKNLSSNES